MHIPMPALCRSLRTSSAGYPGRLGRVTEPIPITDDAWFRVPLLRFIAPKTASYRPTLGDTFSVLDRRDEPLLRAEEFENDELEDKAADVCSTIPTKEI
jgi:hypothetical protein